MADKIFIDGMIAKRRDNAPDFVLCNISVKCEDFEKFMKANHKNGWININVQRSKSTGKVFAELDTWEPNKQGGQQAPQNNAPPQGTFEQNYNIPPENDNPF